MMPGERKAAGIGLGIAGTLLVAYAITPVSLPVLAALVGLWTFLVFFEPRGGIAATVASLALYHHPLETSAGVFAPSELLLVVATGVTAIQFARSIAGSTQPFDLRSVLNSRLVRISAALTLLGLLILATVDDSTARDAGLREVRWTLLAPTILVGLLSGWRLSRRWVLWIALAWLAGTLLSMAPAALDPIRGTAVEAGGVLRISGLYPHPNALAAATTRAIVFGAVLILSANALRTRRAIPIVAGGILLLATFARSALIAAAAVGIIIAWQRGRRVRTATILAVLSGIVGLALVAPDRLLDGLAGGSVDLRLDIWRAGLAMIRDNPVIGVGPDQFFYQYAPRYIEPTGWNERFTSHAHNLLIDAWIRLGIIGAVFAAVALIAVGRDMWNIARGSFHGDALQLAAALALFAAFVQGLVDNSYFVHDLAMSFWLLAWLRFEPVRTEKGPHQNADTGFRWSRSRRLSSLRPSG